MTIRCLKDRRKPSSTRSRRSTGRRRRPTVSELGLPVDSAAWQMATGLSSPINDPYADWEARARGEGVEALAAARVARAAAEADAPPSPAGSLPSPAGHPDPAISGAPSTPLFARRTKRSRKLASTTPDGASTGSLPNDAEAKAEPASDAATAEPTAEPKAEPTTPTAEPKAESKAASGAKARRCQV